MNEKNIFIVRYGEASLKGQNKPFFERMMVERMKKLLRKFQGTTEEKALESEPRIRVIRQEGLVFVRADKNIPSEQIIAQIKKVFGVASISPALEVETNMEAIYQGAIDYVNATIEASGEKKKTFKIEARRADKNFPLKSPDIARAVGGEVLKACNRRDGNGALIQQVNVDVHDPDLRVFVNVRRDVSYIYGEKIMGYGGLPLGTTGKGMLLLSGGIDSPVAGWMMAKRGMRIEAVHFHSFPYTSQRAMEQVKELASILAIYVGGFKVHMVNLLPAQEAIVANCTEEDTTIHIRRFMMKIAEKMAIEKEANVLITGESLGQVASQTAESLTATDNAVTMPVMRPLIGIDKIDIMDMAKEIETFETSIEPNDDCCTVFLPKHPSTKPKLARIIEDEAKLDVELLISEAIEKIEIIDIKPKGA